MINLIIWLITITLFIIGLAGTVIPGLPGLGVVFAGILVFAAATGFTTISVTTVVIFGLITVAAIFADYFASSLGAKIAGGKMKSFIGAILGSIAGFAYAPIGILVGAFLGALVGAYLEGQPTQKALKVALVSVLAVIATNALQLLLGLIMIISFLIAAWT